MANAAMGRYHRQAIYGHKGTLIIERNEVLVYPETFPELRALLPKDAGTQQGGRPAMPESKVYELPEVGPQRDVRTPHTNNFFACVRSRKQPNAPAELGYQMISAIKLGVYAYREGKVKFFDPGIPERGREGSSEAHLRRRR
jgi:hypothetical protein